MLQAGKDKVDVSHMSEFVAEWSPRIGEEASRLQVRGTRFVLLGAGAGVGWIVTQVLASAMRSGGLVVAAVVLLAAAVGFLAAGGYVINRSLQSMSAFLGVKVQFMAAPRLHPDTFRRWCEHHGVEARS